MNTRKKRVFLAAVISVLCIMLCAVPAYAITVSRAVQEPPVLADLPDTVTVPEGASASVSVKVTSGAGTALKYQWYFAESGSSKFAKSSITSNKYSVVMNEARSGRKVYCMVTNSSGLTAKSDTVTLYIAKPLQITTQPKTVTVKAGAAAKTTIAASGQGKLSYQWYVRDPDQTTYTKSSITSATYNVKMKPAINGRRVYCVVTDECGQRRTSQTAMLKMNDTLGIYLQPKDSTVPLGGKATASVQAHGKGTLSYAWYSAAPGSSSFKLTSTKTATYSTTMTAALDGTRLYCVVTDSTGKRATSSTVTLRALYELTIVSQPKNVTVASGKTARASVEISGGNNVKYEWYFASANSEKYTKSSITTNTYSVVMSAARSGRKVYCVITDSTGKRLQSDTAVLKMAAPITITEKPKNVTAVDGQIARIPVKAIGTGELKYEWYIRNADGKKFYKSSVTGLTYAAKMSPAANGRQVYCVITDKYGQKAVTATVTMSLPAPIQINRQPTDVKVTNGSLVSVSTNASGESPLKYQWYVSNAGSSKFYKSSVTSNTYSTVMSDTVNGRRIYCVITDKYGQTATTNTATLSKPLALTIVEQPKDIEILSGKSATLEVKVSGEEDLKYSWYIRNKGKKDFVKSSITGDSYSPIMNNASDGREAYCVISDNYGQTVTTRTAVMTKDPNGLHVLIVGNSHSLDAFWFLRSAYLDQNPGSDICIGILYYSGGSISEHVTAANNFDPVNRYYLNNEGRWVIEHNVTHEYILTDQEWDVILMQPGKEDIVHPTVNKEGRYNLAKIIDKYVDNPHELVWHITWPCPNDETFYDPNYIKQPPEGYKDRLIALYGFDPVVQYTEKLDMTTAQILDDPLYADAWNSGAAVMQAHLTQGIPQIDLYRDYTHLNDFGRLMVGYALAAQLTDKPIEEVGIDLIEQRSRWYTYAHLGDMVVTDEMKEIIVEAANYSLEDPWTLPPKK